MGNGRVPTACRTARPEAGFSNAGCSVGSRPGRGWRSKAHPMQRENEMLYRGKFRAEGEA